MTADIIKSRIHLRFFEPVDELLFMMSGHDVPFYRVYYVEVLVDRT